MSNRTVASSLRLLRRHNGIHAQSLCSARSFSSTSQRAVRSLFVGTGHTELDETLKVIQDKIIYPAYLPPKQRKMVFDPRKKSQLDQNPIIIEVDDEEHQFSSLAFSAIPRKNTIFAQATKQMQEAGDWSNLATLLAGFRKAGYKLDQRRWGALISRAGNSGHISAIVQAAKEYDKTGMPLGLPEVFIRSISFCNAKIDAKEPTEGQTRRARAWTTILQDQLRRSAVERDWLKDAGHMPQGVAKFIDLWKPTRGMLLYTAANYCHARRHQDEKARNADRFWLEDLFAEVMVMWRDSTYSSIAEIPEFSVLLPSTESKIGKNVANSTKDWQGLSPSAYVGVVAQSIRGIELASEILGKDLLHLSGVKELLEAHLETLAKEMSPEVLKDREVVPRMYEQWVGRPSSWK